MRASLSLIGLGAIATSVVAQRVVPLSFSRAGPGHKSLRKRAGTYSQELNNNLTGGGYIQLDKTSSCLSPSRLRLLIRPPLSAF